MIGAAVIAIGWCLLVVGLVVLFGPWSFVGAGVVMVVVGLLVDLDRVKEPARAKRSQPAP